MLQSNEKTQANLDLQSCSQPYSKVLSILFYRSIIVRNSKIIKSKRLDYFAAHAVNLYETAIELRVLTIMSQI